MTLQEQLQNIKNQDNTYSKAFKTYEEQVSILQKRNLTISNPSYILSKLEHINYYRLSAYFEPFQYSRESENKNKFLDGKTFEDIIQLYYFDCELRKLIFEAIESIEIYFRTQITYYHAKEYGAFGYLNKENLETSQELFDKVIESIQDEKSRSQELFIKHFKDTYKTTDLPIWAVVEVISFGTLSKMYTMLKTNEQKQVIQKLRGINKDVFKNWLHGLSVLRNVCAHHSRLWNKILGVSFEVPRKLEQFKSIKGTVNKKGKCIEILLNDKVFFALSVIEYILTCIGEDEINFKVKVKELLKKYPNVNIQSMGFINNWEENIIWRNS